MVRAAAILASVAVLAAAAPALAQPALFATTRVSDNVYIFRYQFHQAMFVVTPGGVIATDPIGRYRPGAVTAYLEEIRPGHPGPAGRLGGKDDVRALKQYMLDLSEAVRNAALQGRCFDTAMTEIKLPKYESWGNYAAYLPGNVERFCEYWGGGY